MASLNDQSFSTVAYLRMAGVAAGLLAVLGLMAASVYWYQREVEGERTLKARFDDPRGVAGLNTAKVAALGDRAVETLISDMRGADVERRYKAIEMLGAIDDPRVVPALAELTASADLTNQLNGVAGLARTGRPEAAEKLWPLTQQKDETLRLRSIIALGLCGGDADLARLEVAIPKAGSPDRYLMGWALGHIQRRLDSFKAGHKGYVTAAPEIVDEAQSIRVQLEVDAALAQIDKGSELREAGKKLAALTDINFATWDYGHQIALQVLAIGGPRQFRPTHTVDEVKPAEPTGVQLRPSSARGSEGAAQNP